MGAEVFITYSRGATAEEAFNEAVRRAQHDWGHSGYTGSIAEKDSFVIIKAPKDTTNFSGYADQLIEDCDSRIDDKWGPAGCIPVGEDKFLFFGWASS